MIRRLVRGLTFAVVVCAAQAQAGEVLDPDTKNRYRAADLVPFTEAAEWIIFSLDPMPWLESDIFPAPAPADGQPANPAPEPKEPKRKVPPEQEFHGYPILGQTKVAVTPELKTVITTIDEAGRRWNGAVAGCFTPRHGIRVTKGGVTHDFLICYECMAAVIYRDSKRTGAVCFVTDPNWLPRPAYLNGALLRAKVKLPPPPRH